MRIAVLLELATAIFAQKRVCPLGGERRMGESISSRGPRDPASMEHKSGGSQQEAVSI